MILAALELEAIGMRQSCAICVANWITR